ncbi:MAG TPA: SIMPL domain-containing protein [Pyrinomonadaceae bacterium]|nr:SIMPL domain-containing protein [Pyrinomonadaceae bacterium]
MKKAFFVFCLLFFVNLTTFAQEAGNKIYGNQGYVNQQLRNPVFSSGDLRNNTQYHRYYMIESNVLLNVKPDSFVVVFGFDRIGSTSENSNDQVNVTFSNFKKALAKLGITEDDIFIDFITQTITTVEQTRAFQTKKTIAIRYKSRDLFEKIVTLAAANSIYDLIKVDYIVSDFNSIRSQLFEEASKTINAKLEKYTTLFGVKLSPKGLEAETYGAFYPGERYVGYQRSFYYQPLSLTAFDKVITPIGIEPVVQFTLYLRMVYDTEAR